MSCISYILHRDERSQAAMFPIKQSKLFLDSAVCAAIKTAEICLPWVYVRTRSLRGSFVSSKISGNERASARKPRRRDKNSHLLVKKPHYGSDDFAWGSEPTCGRNNLPAGAPRCQRQASLDSRRPRCANSCGVGARTVSDGCVEASRAHKARRDRAPCAVFLWVQDDSREKKLSFTKRDPWFTREETMFQEKGSFDYSGLNSTQIQSKAEALSVNVSKNY